MKVLIVASDKGGKFAPFVEEQILALKKNGIEIFCYKIKGKGLLGYLRELPIIMRTIKNCKPNIIHAHYGLSGLLANLQRKIPVVTTYHGSDINNPKILPFSKVSIKLSSYNIFVSQRNIAIATPKNRFTLIPCGVDLTEEQLISRDKAREVLNIEKNEKIILFAGAFNNRVKDAELAKKSVDILNKKQKKVRFVELKNYTRKKVSLLMCAVNCLLMTSKTEGSPQVIKEAMACGCPIVSVDVGDVAERTSGVEGCYIVPSREAAEIAGELQKAITFEGKTNGRERIIEMGLCNEQIVGQLIKIYKQVLV